jgi:hypothetical protein
MFTSLDNFSNPKPPARGLPLIPEPHTSPPTPAPTSEARRQTFAKVFRWRLPAGQTQEPTLVEVVGSFTNWKKVPLIRDSSLDAWHVTLHHIQGHRTHHYMLLVDGKPVYDKECDGLAIPHGPEEERFALNTDRGPRLFMLWAQTK